VIKGASADRLSGDAVIVTVEPTIPANVQAEESALALISPFLG
jgi:hypothetical protein